MTLHQIAPLPLPASPAESGPAVAAVVIGVTLRSLLAFLAAGMTFFGDRALQLAEAAAHAVDPEAAVIDHLTVTTVRAA